MDEQQKYGIEIAPTSVTFMVNNITPIEVDPNDLYEVNAFMEFTDRVINRCNEEFTVIDSDTDDNFFFVEVSTHLGGNHARATIKELQTQFAAIVQSEWDYARSDECDYPFDSEYAREAKIMIA